MRRLAPSVVALALLLSVAPSAAARDSDVLPNQMRGVKFKHPGGDGTIDWSIKDTCDYQRGAGDRSYRSIMQNLHDNGIYHVFIKISKPEEQVPGTCDFTKQIDEIVQVLGAMKTVNASPETVGEPPLRAWVFERAWFWDDRDGGPASGYNTFVTNMSNLIDAARRNDVADPLEGVAPIETNLPSSGKVREYALKVATAINDNTGGWLTNHTLLFPGAGMGSWFKGIGGTAGFDFLDQIKTKVRYFSFIYKFMKSQDKDSSGRHVNQALYPYYYGPTAVWANEIDKGYSEQREYIETTLGFGNLAAFITEARSKGHQWVANVVFWGDSGDGLIQMISRTNVQLMHDLLVEELNQRGYFYDFAIIGSTESDDKDRSKHLLLDQGTAVVQNQNKAYRDRGPLNTMTVYEEWSSWPNPLTIW